MQTPEGKVKQKVKEFLHSRKVQSLTHPIEGAVGFYWMPVTGGYGSPFLDFVICYKGIFVSVETKREGGHPTPRQNLTAQFLMRAGAYVTWGDDAYVNTQLGSLFDIIDGEPVVFRSATVWRIRSNG